MQKHTSALTLVGLAVSTIHLPSTALAAGYQVNEHSASSIGRSNAGNAATVEDAGILAHNVAGLSLLDGTSLSLAAMLVNPSVSAEGEKTTTGQSMNKSDIAGNDVVPGIYLQSSISEKLNVGLGVYSDYGLRSSYGESAVTSEFANTTNLSTINIMSAASYKISPQTSIGGGVAYVYGEADLNNNVPPGAPGEGSELMAMEGIGNGMVWTLGVLHAYSENSFVGFSYKSGTMLELEGDISSDVQPALNSKGSLKVAIPEIADLSLNHKVLHNLSLQASITYTNWEKQDEIKGEIDSVGDLSIRQNHWNESYRYALGATYQLLPMLKLRSGVAYDQSPVDEEYRSLSIPDSDRRWYSAGVSYQPSKNFGFDFGYSFIDGDEVTVNETSALGTQFSGSTEGNAHIYSIQTNMSF